MTNPPYLIVLTRHPIEDASARFLLRHAASLARRGHPTKIVVAQEIAYPEALQHLDDIGLKDWYVWRDEAGTASRPVEPGVLDHDSDEAEHTVRLASLMRAPGQQIYWCQESRLRLAAIATSSDPPALLALVSRCEIAARSAWAVRVFFRDESIPAICRPEIARTLAFPSDLSLHAALDSLAQNEDVRLFACTSSLYVWGVEPAGLISAIAGPRGLIAFLAEDLPGADQVLTS